MNGFVCIDKPQGLTSFSAAARCRRLFEAKKAGHTGTLDPMATGVLVVALGAATRFIEELPSREKAYRAVFRLGIETDTLDSTGAVLRERAVTASAKDVESALSAFRGTILQTPPMYSALRKNGVRLYELARQGKEIEREAREVRISELELTAFDEAAHTYTIRVVCSAGTYIRSLIADIGASLGCGAVMTALCRTAANGFLLEESKSLAQLEEMKTQSTLQTALRAIPDVLDCLRITVSEAQSVRFANGGALSLDRLQGVSAPGRFCVFSPAGTFLGIGFADGESELLVAKKLMPQQGTAET